MTSLVKENPGKPLQVDVLRDGHRVSLSVTPVAESTTVNGQTVADRQNWHRGTRPLAYAIHDSARRDL